MTRRNQNGKNGRGLKVVAIDFGTWNTAVTVGINGRFGTFTHAGSPTIPTAVYLKGKGDVLIGGPALAVNNFSRATQL